MLLAELRRFSYGARFIFSLAFVALTIRTVGAAPPEPHVTLPAVSQTVVDIDGGTKAHYAFMVRNEGSAPLRITDVKPSCGCTVADYPKEIPAGGAGTISAEVQTQPSWTSFVKDLAVSTNDPIRPKFDLSLEGKVIPLYTISPSVSLAEQYEKPAPITKVFSIRFRPGRHLKLVGPPATSGPTQARIDPDPHVPDLWNVTVTLTPPPGGGTITGDVQLMTNAPDSQPIHLQLTGINTRGVTVAPRQIVLGTLLPGKTVQQSVNVFSQGSTFHIKGVESDDPHLTLKVIPVKLRFSWYNIEVGYAGGWSKGIHRGVITVRTDLDIAPSIAIPYAADVR